MQYRTGKRPDVEADRNSFFFKVQRDVNGDRVTVSANWIARQNVWSMQCKMNGELLDASLAEDPWKEARAMIEAAFMDDDTPVTATVIAVQPEAELEDQIS